MLGGRGGRTIGPGQTWPKPNEKADTAISGTHLSFPVGKARPTGTLCTFFTFAPSSNSQLEPSDLSSRPARLRRTASAAAVGTSDATEWLASVARGAVDARLTSSMSNTVWISVFLLDEARGCSHSLLAQRLEQPERPWVHAIFFSTLTPLNSELRRPA